MDVVWILLGLAVFEAVAITIGRSYARAHRSNLGFVSRQWLTEHNLDK